MITDSRRFRGSAIDSARRIHQRGDQFCSTPGLDEVVIADLLRRSCSFTHVPDVVMAGIEKAPDNLITNALKFQLKSAAVWDTMSYTFGLKLVKPDYEGITISSNQTRG